MYVVFDHFNDARPATTAATVTAFVEPLRILVEPPGDFVEPLVAFVEPAGKLVEPPGASWNLLKSLWDFLVLC